MASLSQLDVVNACLGTMGESPLIAIDTDHPYVQAALRSLGNASTVEQGEGYWFNEDYVSLPVDPTTGFVYVPADSLDVETGYNMVIQRGRRLYDRSTSTYDLRPLINGGPVTVKVIREIPFEDLPPMAQQVVSYRAQLDFQQEFDGDQSKYSKLGGAYTNASRLLKAEDIRQQRVNLFNSQSMQSKLRLIRPLTRGGSRRFW